MEEYNGLSYEIIEYTEVNISYNESEEISHYDNAWNAWSLSFLPLVILILWTFIGNALVLIAVYRERTLKSMSNYVIASLAMADLLLSVLVMPLGLVNLVSKPGV